MKRTITFSTLAAVAVATVFAAVFPVRHAAAEGDPAHGEEVFGKCALCHQIGKDARNYVGPALNGVYGAPAAAKTGFNYSRALNEAGRNGLVWNEDNLNRYLEDPRGFLTGGRMAFSGLPDAGDRADIIAYLKQFPGN